MIKIDSIRENTINHIIDKYLLFFLGKKNVTGIGMGYKIIKKFKTNELSLHVFVEKKVSLNNLNKKDIVPKNFLGIPTDVIEFGIAKKSAYMSNKSILSTPLIKRVRPIRPGYSIGPSTEDYSGTLGAIVFDNDTDAPYILSNNHILSDINKLKKGTTILQPSIEDSSSNSSNIIARLDKFINLNFKDLFSFTFSEDRTKNEKAINYVDCAIAKINPNIKYDTFIEHIGEIKGTILPKINKKVQKSGRTTGYTTGSIISINASIDIEFDKLTKCHYKNQIILSKMSNSGDSGSLVLDFNNRVIGLLHASSWEGSIVSPIKTVLTLLNVHF